MHLAPRAVRKSLNSKSTRRPLLARAARRATFFRFSTEVPFVLKDKPSAGRSRCEHACAAVCSQLHGCASDGACTTAAQRSKKARVTHRFCFQAVCSRRIEHEDSFTGRWLQLRLAHVLLVRAQWWRLEQQARLVLAHRAVPQPSVPHASAADRRQNASHAVGGAEKCWKI